MVVVGIFADLIVLPTAASAMSLCFAYYSAYKHKVVLNLSYSMAGLFFLSVAVFGLEIEPLLKTGGLHVPPGFLYLTWSAIGVTVFLHYPPGCPCGDGMERHLKRPQPGGNSPSFLCVWIPYWRFYPHVSFWKCLQFGA